MHLLDVDLLSGTQFSIEVWLPGWPWIGKGQNKQNSPDHMLDKV